MPKIYVNREFTLQLGGEKRNFAIGNHTVDAETAKHWYVQAHIGDEPISDNDASAATDALLAELNEKEQALALRAKEIEIREADLAEREQAIATREHALADRVQAEQNAQSTSKDDAKSASNKSNQGK